MGLVVENACEVKDTKGESDDNPVFYINKRELRPAKIIDEPTNGSDILKRSPPSGGHVIMEGARVDAISLECMNTQESEIETQSKARQTIDVTQYITLAEAMEMEGQAQLDLSNIVITTPEPSKGYVCFNDLIEKE